eukprot:TRINITY_DN10466_c0_g1_i1.p1 TRINITY_DN10466_c0_g1~~TRINITY_DN10466_c0_g1_i1.p1  ORF type:complete len:110 (-),score=23.95 TRINITY_DN10466_c0_g1_i1:45-374(-)
MEQTSEQVLVEAFSGILEPGISPNTVLVMNIVLCLLSLFPLTLVLIGGWDFHLIALSVITALFALAINWFIVQAFGVLDENAQSHHQGHKASGWKTAPNPECKRRRKNK